MALILVLAGIVALLIDLPVAGWVAAGSCPRAIEKLCSLSEVFGHGLGVAVIALTFFVLDPLRRPRLPRILTAALGAGLFADVLKMFVARVRPHHFNFHTDVSTTFRQWLPLWHGPSAMQSFPSSHTATAVGLAVALVTVYPRGKWLFPLFAALVAGQRLTSGAHFLSDTLWGAACGYLVGSWCVGEGRLSAQFNKLERLLECRYRDESAPNLAREISQTEPSEPEQRPTRAA